MRDFPKLPVLDNSAKFEIVSSVLAIAINKTIFATGSDDSASGNVGSLL